MSRVKCCRFQTKCLLPIGNSQEKESLLGNKQRFLGPPTFVCPVHIQSVSDSRCHLVSQPLIRDKPKQLHTYYSTVLFSVSHSFQGFLITYKEDANILSLLSYNWHTTDVFMTHELFIHLDNIQVARLCLASLLSAYSCCSLHKTVCLAVSCLFSDKHTKTGDRWTKIFPAKVKVSNK